MFCLFTPFQLNRSLFEPSCFCIYLQNCLFYRNRKKKHFKNQNFEHFYFKFCEFDSASNVTSKCEKYPFKCSVSSLNLSLFLKQTGNCKLKNLLPQISASDPFCRTRPPQQNREHVGKLRFLRIKLMHFSRTRGEL